MSGQEGLDVFVSHHGQDTKRGFSAWLRRDLERRMFSCFFDEYSLRRGDSAWATIAKALSNSKVVVVVLSRGFFTSKYCLRELHMCRAQGKRVVPIFFDITPDECRPDALASKVPGLPWDSHDGEWDGLSWEEDVQWIKSIVGLRLEALDGFQDRCIDMIIQDVARLLGRPAVDILTKVDLTPFSRNARFVGREGELERLEKLLGEDGKAFVTGIGGMGKTQLLLEYVYRHKGCYAKVLWIDGSLQSRLANFLALAKHVGVELEKEGAGAEAENIRRVKDALGRAEAPYLLVMDNVDEEEGMWDMLPHDGLCHVLVSTRLNQLSDMSGIHLLELDEGDALTLLIGKEKNLVAGDLLILANRLGRLTLALAVSSRILADKVTPQELIRRLDQKGAEAFKSEKKDPKYGMSPDLVHLFDISMELVRRSAATESTLAEAMVKVGGWFASALIPFHLLVYAAAELSAESGEVAGAEAFRLLVRSSLGDRDSEGRASFHQLIQEYGRFLGGQGAGKAMVSAVKSDSLVAQSAVHYQNAFDLTIPGTKLRDIALGEDGRLEVVQQIGIPLVYHYIGASFQLAQARTVVSNFPEGGNQNFSAAILTCKGRVLKKTGEYEEAMALYERSLRIQEKALGSEHPEVAFTLDNMALLLGSQGKYEEALPLSKRALRISEKVLGPEHPEVAVTLGNMALLLMSQGKYGEALPLLERALRITEKALGPEDPSLATMLDNMALLLERQGKYEEALPLSERALRISEKVLGPEHPEVATTLSNMAGLLKSQGKYGEALPLYERALPILEKALGLEHPDVASTLINMAGLLERQGRYEGAVPLYERALRILEKALGPEHPTTLTGLVNMATLLRSQGKYEEALPLYERALRIRKKALGPEHPQVATTLGNMALLLQRQGKYEEPLPLYKHALRIQEKALGSEHPDVATTLTNMASLLMSQGKYEEALPLYERALCISEMALGPDHPQVATKLNEMAGLHYSQGKYEEALPLYERALRIKEKALGPEHPEVAPTFGNMALLLDSQGKYEEALPLYERALRISEKALGPEHPDVAPMLGNLARLLENQGKYEEALPLFKRDLRISEKVLGPEHPIVATTLNSMATLLRRQGKFKEALPYERILRGIMNPKESSERVGAIHPAIEGVLKTEGAVPALRDFTEPLIRAPRPDNAHCAHCREKGSLLQCSRCKSVLYCNQECQKQHWSAHKVKCRKPH